VITNKGSPSENGGSLKKVGSLVNGHYWERRGHLKRKVYQEMGGHREMEGHKERWGSPKRWVSQFHRLYRVPQLVFTIKI